MDQALANAIRVHASGKLMDIGCGLKPYGTMTKGLVESHVGIDHENTLHDKSNIDRFGTAYELPAEDAEFDTALCTAVLEHLEEPARALSEVARALKPGGRLILTAPLFWHLHEEPRDFFRYTRYGLQYLLETNGYEVVEMIPLSGFVVTFSQELVYFLYRFRRRRSLNPLRWFIRPLCAIIQMKAYLLSRIDRSKEFTWMYLVVARKK